MSQYPRVQLCDPRVSNRDPRVRLCDPRVNDSDPRVQLSDPRVNNSDPWVRRSDPRVASATFPPRLRIRDQSDITLVSKEGRTSS
jgi:hypothetical protein